MSSGTIVNKETIRPSHHQRQNRPRAGERDEQKCINEIHGEGAGEAVEEYTEISVHLEDESLWQNFYDKTNEMIVTRNGRRMFPIIRCKLSGLQPTAFYSILLEFRQIEVNRFKFLNGEWISGGKAELAPKYPIYQHPDSPNYGSHWTKEAIAFMRVKLTNKGNSTKERVALNSLHKYEPHLHVVKVSGNNVQQIVRSFAFPSTQFIAVTAYQNEDVTRLKIQHNPFAKAFQQTMETRGSYSGFKREADNDVLCRQDDPTFTNWQHKGNVSSRNSRQNKNCYKFDISKHPRGENHPYENQMSFQQSWPHHIWGEIQNQNYNQHHQPESSHNPHPYLPAEQKHLENLTASEISIPSREGCAKSTSSSSNNSFHYEEGTNYNFQPNSSNFGLSATAQHCHHSQIPSSSTSSFQDLSESLSSECNENINATAVLPHMPTPPCDSLYEHQKQGQMFITEDINKQPLNGAAASFVDATDTGLSNLRAVSDKWLLPVRSGALVPFPDSCGWSPPTPPNNMPQQLQNSSTPFMAPSRNRFHGRQFFFAADANLTQ